MTASLVEIQRDWSIDDLWDANEVLDELDRAEEQARTEAEGR